LSNGAPSEPRHSPVLSVEILQEGNGPLPPCEQTDTTVLQSGGCIQSTHQTV
ncbi:hypothetical protein MKX03_007785, partial [Papaver bracteatum]